jgi:hypothetical protein
MPTRQFKQDPGLFFTNKEIEVLCIVIQTEIPFHPNYYAYKAIQARARIVYKEIKAVASPFILAPIG